MKSLSGLKRIPFEKLINKESNLSSFMKEAFDKNGLGAFVVTDVPKLLDLRSNLVKNTDEFLSHPLQTWEKYKRPEISYQCGFEDSEYLINNKLKKTHWAWKCSPTHDTVKYKGDKIIEDNFQTLWPSEIPTFKQNFTALGRILLDIQLRTIYHVDKYLESLNLGIESLYSKYYEKHFDYGRYIIYHPVGESQNVKDQVLIPMHRDVGIVTALICPAYLKESTLERIGGIPSKLTILDNQGKEHLAEYGEDEILVQSGDLLYFLSGGEILPTPHEVRYCEKDPKDVYRVTMGMFLVPELEEKLYLPKGFSREDLNNKDVYGNNFIVGKKHLVEGMDSKEWFIGSHKDFYNMDK